MLYYNICCFDVLQTAKAAFYNEKTDQGGYYVRRAKGGGGAQSMGVPYETGYEGIKEVPNVAPRTIPCPMNPRKIRQLTVEEIHQMVELYARSCARAKKSGFDGVEIHAHGGYLLSEFLSPFYNNRTDEYGGTFENQTRVLFEIIEKVQAYCGANYPIIVRFAADEPLLSHRIMEVTENALKAMDIKTKEVKEIPFDTLVVALGNKPENSLETAISQNYENYYIIGDANSSGNIAKAINDGFVTAMKL